MKSVLKKVIAIIMILSIVIQYSNIGIIRALAAESGVQIANSQVYFYDLSSKQITEADQNEEVRLRFQIGMASSEETEGRDVHIYVSEANFYFNDFRTNASGELTYVVENGGVDVEMVLTRNEDGTQVITVKNLVQGQTVNLALGGYFTDDAVPNESVTARIEEGNSATLTVKNVDDAANISNTKTVSKNSISFTRDNTTEMAAQFPIEYTIGASFQLKDRYASTETLNKLTINDEITFPDGMSISAGSNIADYISVSGTSVFSASDFTAVYSSDNSKIVGIKLNKDITGSDIETYLNNGAKISLLYANGMTIEKDGNITNTVSTGYETTNFTGSASPVTVNTSVDVLEGSSFDNNSKRVVTWDGDFIDINTWDNDNASGYFIQDDTITFKLTSKNTGDEAGDVTINDIIPDGTSIVSTSPAGTSSTITINEQNKTAYSWTFNNVQPGETVEATIQLKIDNNANYTIQNKMYLNNDYTSEVASSKEYEVKTKRAEINVKKTAESTSGDFTNPGDTVVYTITVSNTGSADTTIPVYDIFPSQLEYVSSEPSGTYTAEHEVVEGNETKTVPAEISWGDVSLPVGTTLTYKVTAKVKDGVTGSITNKAKADDKEASVTTKVFDESVLDNMSISKYTATTYAEKGDTVNYKITVSNHTGYILRVADLPDGKIVIEDELPSELSYESGAYYMLPDDETHYTNGISFDNNTLKVEITSSELSEFAKNKAIEVYVPAKVVSDPLDSGDREITNTAKVYEKTATATIKQEGNNGIKLEKYVNEIKDTLGNTIYKTQLNTNNEAVEVSVGEEYYVTYSTRVYNTSSEDITLDENNGYFQDNPVYGLFAASDTDYNVVSNKIVNVVVTNSEGTAIADREAQLGYYWDSYSQNSFNMQFDLSGTTVPANDYITITYTLKTHASGVSGDINQRYFIKGNNTISTKLANSTSQEIKNKAFTPSMDKKVALVDESSLALVDGNIDLAHVRENYSQSFINSLDFSDEQKVSISTLKDKYLVYKVAVDMKNFVNEEYILTDTISDNLEFVVGETGTDNLFKAPIIALFKRTGYTYGETEFDEFIQYGNAVLSSSDVSVNDNTLTVHFRANEQNLTKDYVELYYLVKLKDGEYTNLANKIESGEISLGELLNSANVKTESVDELGNPTYEESDVAPVYVNGGSIHPGEEKEFLGSFPDGYDKEYDAFGNPIVTTGSANAGAHLVWKITVKNDKDEFATTMKNFKVVDTLPSPYIFDDNYEDDSNTNAKFKPIMYVYDANGNVTRTLIGEDFIKPTVTDTRVLTWTFNGDEWALEPGEKIEIIFPSKVEGAGVQGAFLNVSQVITEQTFEKTDVSDGDYIDEHTIEDTAFANIYAYVTNSYKEIEYDPALATGVDYKQPAADTGVGKKVDGVLDNVVQGHQGEKVKYTLNIKNESLVRLTDLVIIDRLPYVGDKGVIADYDRKSAFNVKWDSFISAKVYDENGNYSRTIDSSKIKISFSDNKTDVFSYNANDWKGSNDVATWTDSATDDTVNVRFEIIEDDSTYLSSKETLKIEFYGIIPGDVDVIGEENLAWNNFAYGYLPIDDDRKPLSNYNIAEPAKVGVWVEEQEKINIEGKKIWSDYENKDNTRPSSVTVKLLADGEVVDEVEITADDNWKYEFKNKLVRNEQGQKITYTVEEAPVSNYTTSIAGFNITNTYIAKTSVSGTKTWNDKNNNDDTRPASITVNLYANEDFVTSKTVSADVNGDWKYEFTGLDKYDENNELISYTITESEVKTKDGTGTYTSVVDGYNITNTFVPKTSVSGTKTWTDYDNIENTRPSSIVVNLVKGGSIIDSKTVTVDQNGDWKYEFTNLDKYDENSELIEYSVTENPVDKYTTSIDGYNIENTYIAKVNVSGTKTWEDYDNKEDTRPSTIKINLLQNGEKVDEQTVSASSNWTFEFTNLDKYYKENNEYKSYVYTITEDEVKTKDGTGTYSSNIVAGSTSNTFAVTNTYEVKTSYTVTKVWEDSDNQDGARPKTIKVQLWANDVAQGEPVELSAGSDEIWQASELTYTWNDLEKYDDDNELITYKATEVAVPDEYSVEYDRTTTDKTTIVTNTHTPDETQYTVKKVWNDNDNQDGKRPTRITVQLKADNEDYGDAVELKTGDDGKWDAADLTYTWNNLPKNKNGNPITYSVVESEVGENYTTAYDTESEDKTTIITNTREIEKTTYTVKKIWADNDNQDGKRPTSITVQLKADDEDYGDAVELKTGDDGKWDAADLTYTWSNLPKNKEGNLITYSVVESEVGENYTTAYDTESEDKTTIITNTREIEETEYTVNKVWNDGDNQDGKRPTSITVQLKANGSDYGAAVTLEAGADGVWDAADLTYTWRNLPKNKEGNLITYTVVESEVGNNYTTNTVDNAETKTTTITNTREIEKTQYTINKIWNDGDNQDGKRPTSITVQLKANGSDYGAAVTLEASGENGKWNAEDLTYTWSNLPKNENGELITYTVVESEVGNSYTTNTVDNAETKTTTITNTREIEKTTYTVKKVWNDNNNQDGKRPTSIEVVLKQDGVQYGNAITLTTGNDNVWDAADLTYTWDDLPVNRNGKAIKYTIEEKSIGEGYSTTYDTSVSGETTITNSYTPGEVTYSVEKVWEDNNNQDNKRPESIIVELQVNGSAFVYDGITARQTLNGDNEWKYTWEHLPEKQNGDTVEYKVKEITNVSDYNEPAYTYTAGKTTIVNARETDKTTYSVKKVWDDNNNQDGIRPASISVQLKAKKKVNGEIVTVNEGSAQTLNLTNNWEYEWTNLEKNSEGEAIEYSIEELGTISGYEVSYDTSVVGKTTITNKHTPEETEYTVKKVWNDNNNQDGKRPTSITVQLKADNEDCGEPVELKTGDDGVWDEADLTYTWSNLPVNKSGNPITYSVVESEVGENYTAAYDTESEEDTTIITNTRSIEETEYTVKKVWNDNDNQDGKRPTSIIVQLLADDQVYGDAVELKSGDDGKWDASDLTYTWSNLPKNKEGKTIIYSVVESEVGEDYTTAYDTESEEKTTIITNTRAIEKTTYNVEKVWNDNNNQDGKRPASISVQLKKNNSNCGDLITLNPSNNWKYEWTNLDKNENGVEINYSAEEVGTVEDYTTSKVTTKEKTTITNTKEIEKTTYYVKKVWDDNNNQDGIRPLSIRVQLRAEKKVNGEIVTVNEGDEQELSSANRWEYTWSNLNKNSEGTEIKYSIVELGTISGYEVSYDTSVEGKTTITNKHTSEETEYVVNKVWNDKDNQDGKRPTSITVQLLADGNPCGDAVVLSAGEDGKWDAADLTYKWENLPKKANGKDIKYSVEESNVSGYSASQDTSAQGVTTITNSYTPGEVTYSVEKKWNDNDNQDNKRPESIEVELQVNGETFIFDGVTAKQTLNESNSWKYTWEHLPEKLNGNTVEYKVKELTNLTDYNTPTYSYTSGKTTITNTRTTDKTTYSVKKVWDDSNNQDGIRPQSINVQLKAKKKVNGEFVTVNEGSAQTLNLANNWEYEWTNLEKNSEGEAIEYSIEELGTISGYEVSYDTSVEGKTTITNKHTPEETEYSVQKVWADSNNQDGKRPTSITVKLKANGNTVGDAVVLTTGEDGKWDAEDLTYTWKNLPKNSNGEPITYTVEETALNNGYSTVHDSTTYSDRTIITNSYTPGKVSYSVEKVWDDNNNQDGKRPNTILVELVAEAQNEKITLENVEIRQTLNSENHWKYTWNDLPQMSEGRVIDYSVVEISNITDYNNPTYNYSNGKTTITNKHNVEKTTKSVEKVWDDKDNQDGIRPESIKVQLKANGNVVDESEVTLNKNNNWKYTWVNLDVYKNGDKITYEVVETSSVDGYEVSSKVEGDKTTITNKHIPEETSYTVEKVWDDNNNQDGVRPVSIKIQLKANGINYGEPIALEAGLNGKWKDSDLKYTWTGLPKNSNGKAIEYTVEELDVNSNYTVIPLISEGKTIITNRHIPEVTTYTAEKVWIDNDNQDGIRPTKVEVKLKADGEIVEEAILSEANHWKVTWNDLDKYSDGRIIKYEVEETSIPDGYEALYDVSVDGITVIQNKHIPEETSYSVEKIWSDSGNFDKIRPDAITIQLLANGEKYGDEIILHADIDNGWTESSSKYIWEHLPKRADGVIIEYTAEEVSVPEGYSVMYKYEENKTIINNVHIPHRPRPTKPTITIKGKKVWEDNNDEYGIRPDSVTINLSQDGELIMTYFATADKNWEFEFKGLPKFDDNGKEIVYTLSEKPVDGYTSKVDGTNIINTIIPVEEPEVEEPVISIKTGDNIIISIVGFIISVLTIAVYTVIEKKRENK